MFGTAATSHLIWLLIGASVSWIPAEVTRRQQQRHDAKLHKRAERSAIYRAFLGHVRALPTAFERAWTELRDDKAATLRFQEQISEQRAALDLCASAAVLTSLEPFDAALEACLEETLTALSKIKTGASQWPVTSHAAIITRDLFKAASDAYERHVRKTLDEIETAMRKDLG